MSYWSHYFEILRRVGVLFVPLSLLGFVSEQYHTLAIEDLLKVNRTFVNEIWVHAGVSLVTGFLLSTTLILLVCGTELRLRNRAFAMGPMGTFSLILKENFRMWGSVLTYGLFFLIPGFWRFIQLQFLPFVVAFDESYARGEKDALKASAAIAKNKMGILFWIWFLEMIFTFGFSLFDQNQAFFIRPWVAVPILAIQSLVMMGLFVYLMRASEQA